MNAIDQIFLMTIWALWLILAVYAARCVYTDLTKPRGK